MAVVFGFSTTAKAVTIQELMDQIASLQAQVQALRGQQTATAQPSTSTMGPNSTKFISLISPAKYSDSDIKDPENPLEIRWSTGFESSGPSLPLTVDKLNIILVKDRCFDPIMSGGPGPKSIGKYMVIGSGIPKGQVYYQWKISEEFINLMGDGDCKYKLWIGEYKPPSQTGDWDSINMYTSSPAYGVFDESAVRITTKKSDSFVSPTPGQVVKIGDTLKIETSFYGSGIGSSDIFLINGDNSDITPIFTQDWLKIYMWKIPSTVKPGNNYYIHIGTSYLQGEKLTLSSGGLRSGRFIIEDPSKTQKYISMISPENNLVLNDPSTIDIKWSSQKIDKVNIYLVKSVQSTGINFGGSSFTYHYYFTIASEVSASDGHYVWNIPDEIERSHLRQGTPKYSIFVGEWRPPDTNGKWEDFGTTYGAYANYSASVVGYAYTANLFPLSTRNAIVIFRQSVTINNPKHNQSFMTGDTINVSWSIDNREPEIGAKTMILGLYDTVNQIYSEIGPEATGEVDYCVSCYTGIPIQQGSYNWTIPSTVSFGNSYIIVMAPPSSFGSGKYWSYSSVSYYFDKMYAFSEPFTITPAPPTPQASIVITSPNGGEAWKPGTTHNITWSSTGVQSVSIYLRKAGKIVKALASCAQDTGTYLYTLSSDITKDTDYEVTVSYCTLNSGFSGPAEDTSDDFTITNEPATTTSCSQLYSKITASYLKSCGDAAYDPTADIDKSKKVDLGDMSFYAAHTTDETWCQQKLSETTSPCPIINLCHTFNQNLGYGQSGLAEIGYLHTALDREGISYAPDTGNTFGQGTSSAVVTFQEKYASDVLAPYSLTRGTGYVGVSTRAKLNALYGCETSGETCTSNWVCDDWSACANNQQTRTCTDSNNCGVTTGKPAESQTCTATCTPNWNCTAWGMCANGQQTKICTDSNNCGVDTGKPVTTQNCTTTNYCSQFYSKLTASYNKKCGDIAYDPLVDVDKDGDVDSGDQSFYAAHTTDQSWCQQRLAETKSPCATSQPSITVTSPNGGETWKQGETHNITWTSNGVDNVMIELDKTNPNTGWHLTYSVPASSGSFSWIVPVTITPGYDYKVKIWDTTNSSITDLSNNYFAIAAPANLSCVATTINGYFIPTTASGSSFTASTTSSVSNGTRQDSVTFTCNNGTFTTGAETANIICNSGYSLMGTSCAQNPQSSITITITSPNGGENWQQGTQQTIGWNVTGVAAGTTYRLVLYKDNLVYMTLANTISGTNYNWTIPEYISAGTIFKMRVEAINSGVSGGLSDFSNNYFAISAPLTCVDSDNGKNYNTRGTTSNSQGGSFTDNCVSGFSYNLVEGYCDSSGIVRTEHYYCPNGCENGVCRATTAQSLITVTSPNGGETWEVGTHHKITWTSFGLGANDKVTITLLANSADSGTVITSGILASAGVINDWYIPDNLQPGTTYKIKISDLSAGASGTDISNNYFTIVEPNTFCSHLDSKITASYSTQCGEPGYDPVADVNKDGFVKLSDRYFYSDHSTEDGWCQERLNDTSSPSQCTDIYCSKLYTEIGNHYSTTCAQTTLYSPAADINKDGHVNSNDMSIYNAHKTDQTWCQQKLNDTSSPCATSYQYQLDSISNSLASIYESIRHLLGQ